MAKTITGLKAGTTRITASYTDGGVTKTSYIDFTVSKIDATLTFTVNDTTLTYNGNPQKIGTINYTGDGTVKYYVSTSNSAPGASVSGWVTISSWTTTNGASKTFNVTQTNVGTYYIFLQASEGTNYNAVAVKAGNSTGKSIVQKEVGLSWGTVSWTYDGNTHSTTCSATGVISEDTCTVTLTGNSVGKNVGTATVTASSLSNSNYKLPSSKTKTISITQREVTLTWGTVSWTYDGNTHSTTCTTGNLVSGDTCTVTLDGNSVGKNVGSATVTATELSNSNYKLPTSGLTKTISITQKEVTLTWGTSTWTYDGSAHSTTCTLGGVVSGDTCTLTLGNNSITYVGSQTVTTSLSNTNYKLPSSNTKTISVTKRTPSITLSSVNKSYDGNKYYSYVTVSDAKGTLYWKKGSAPTTSSYGGTVDISSVGDSLGTNFPTAYVQNNADDCTLYWIFVPSSSATITSGQTYAANYNDSASGSVTMTITASAITIPTISAVEVTYDGAAHSLTFPAVTGAEITKYQTSTNGSTWTDASPATTNPSLTNADTLYVRAYYTADSNHSGSGYTTGKTIKINKKTVTVTAGSASRAYNGSALTRVDGTTASGLITNHSLTSYTNTGSQTYVGSSSNVPSGAVIKSGTTDVTSNYAITYANGTLTVTKATPVVSITGVTEDYTGGQFWATATVNAKGTLYWKKGSAPTTSSNDGNVPISSINTATNITSVKDNSDDFEMYWLFVPSNTANSLSSGHTYAENFTNAGGTSSDHKPLTINPRSISNVTASAAAVIYNGSQQTATVSISDSGGNLTSSDYTISGNTGTNATNYTITITGRNNYTGTKTITWTINKRPVTITADSASKTYDGTALTKNSVTASTQNDTNNTGMILSHHVHSWTVSGTQTIAGSSNNTVTAATIYTGASSTHGGSGDTTNVTSNYNITFAKGTLTVNTRAVTATATDQTKVYNGSKLTATNTGTVTNLPSNHTITYSCTGEIGPGVSSGTKTLSSVVIKNSGGTDVTSSFAVTKKNGTLSITAATITYTNTSPVSEYCTATAAATTKTLGSVSISIASASATDYSGAAITSGSNPSVEGYTISQSGWSISSDGKTITVPANVDAGTYNITVTAAKPNHTSKTNGIGVTLIAVELSTLTLTPHTNTILYGGTTEVDRVKATYSNGAWKDVKDDATYTTNPTGIITIS